MQNKKTTIMKKTKIVAAAMMAAMVTPTMAQETSTKKGEGKVIVNVFTDLKSGFGSVNDERGFELSRAYLGYDYKLANGLELKAVADFSNIGEGKGLIKNAFAKWNINKKWSIQGGLISTTQFKVQESFWGKRYIMKSFQDEYKFGSSADLGISASFKPCKVVGIDAIIVNGNGYKELQVKRGFQYGAGVTVNPNEHWVIRLYGSYNEHETQATNGVTNFAAFAGFKTNGFKVGAEYNYQWTTKCVSEADMSGMSVFASGKVSKSCDLFARYDYLTSKDGWNEGSKSTNDGSTIIAGADFKLGKYISLAPNFRVNMPKADGEKAKPYLYVNAAFNL